MQKNDYNQSKSSFLVSNKCIQQNDIFLFQNIIVLKDKETENMKRELLKLQHEIANKNDELEKFQSSMNHEKISLTSKQDKIIDQWREKYEKVIISYFNF